MKSARVVESLAALAHENRLAIYRLLIRQGPEGLPAGTIGGRVGITPSSLTFHLQALQRAGLIRQVRAGRQLFYSADFAAMSELVDYLTDECCIESATAAPGLEPPRAGRKPKSSRAA
jgi:DNA-binding transcriptional ArsR family regulator